MNNGAEEVLGRKHMIAALIKLRKNGEITQSDLNEYITNWKIVKDRIDLLCENGLVEERLDRDGRLVMKYSTSPKGRFIGNLLLMADMAMKDRIDYEGGELCRCLETECAKILNEDEGTSERRRRDLPE